MRPRNLTLNLVIVSALSVACGSRQSGDGRTASTAATTRQNQGFSAAQKARLHRIEAAAEPQRCHLLDSVDLQRDRGLIGPVLELAWRDKTAHDRGMKRPCTVKLLTAMGANSQALQLMRTKPSQRRGLALIAWAGWNVRERAMPAVLQEALRSTDPVVRLAAVAKIGRFPPRGATIATLRQALAHTDKAVRLRAVQAATQIDHPEAAMALHQRKRQETDAEVLAAISRALSP